MARQSMAKPLDCLAGGERRGNREKPPAVALTDPLAFSPGSSIPLHPSLAALFPRLQLVRDCWHLLACPREGDRRERYLPRGEREPEAAYRRRLEAALPSGFFRSALRSFAGMLASSHWRELPASLQAVISDVDGCGTDLGVFLEDTEARIVGRCRS